MLLLDWSKAFDHVLLEHLVGVLHDLASQTLWDDAPCEVGYLFNASKPIEQMTPFFMWQAIFGRLFCNETLLRLKELSAQVTAAGSKPKEHTFPASLESSKTMGDIVKAAERVERAERVMNSRAGLEE